MDKNIHVTFISNKLLSYPSYRLAFLAGFAVSSILLASLYKNAMPETETETETETESRQARLASHVRYKWG